MHRYVVCGAFVVATLLSGVRAEAEVPPTLRPGTRPMFFHFQIGPSIGLVKTSTQFMMTQEFGWHFNGTSEGPAIGGAISESFGSGAVGFSITPKFWWDIQPLDTLGLYLTPYAQLGYLLFGATGGGGTAHFFNIHFGFMMKLMLGDRGFVSFQPFSLDMGAGDTFVMRYNLLFGGGATF